MGYTKKFKNERYWHIAEALEGILTLEEGGKLVFFDLSLEEQAEIRWLLYDYFHHKDLTQDFHIYSSEGLLTVRKKRKTKAKFFILHPSSKELSSMGEKEILFRDSLECPTLEEATAYFITNEVPPLEIEGLLERWKKVMG